MVRLCHCNLFIPTPDRVDLLSCHFQADDPELQEIRRKRMAELQAQSGAKVFSSILPFEFKSI
jgi:hypothetical protein